MTRLLTRRGLAERALALATAATLASAGVAAAQPSPGQPYPNRPIRIVVPFAAGGGIDTVSRPLAQHLSGILGQPVLVDNRPGAAGNIGLEHVADAAPDGYTLLHANSGVLVTNPLLYPNLRAKPDRDLTPVGQVTTDPLLYIVPASLPVAQPPGVRGVRAGAARRRSASAPAARAASPTWSGSCSRCGPGCS